MRHTSLSIRTLYLVILSSSLIVAWLSQHSINAYWLQTYHQATPIESFLQIGQKIQTTLNQTKQNFNDWLSTHNNVWVQTHRQIEDTSSNFSIKKAEPIVVPEWHIQSVLPSQGDITPRVEPTEMELSHQDNTRSEPSYVKTKNNELQINSTHDGNNVQHILTAENVHSSGSPLNTDDKLSQEDTALFSPTRALLTSNQQVLFVGDSLMQGVAPNVQQWLKKNHKISSLNLSKQNSGLSYPSFFNWPLTVEQALRNNPKIKLIVVFLGANDPWDIPNPKAKGATLKFKTPEWESVYRAHIQRILDSAQNANAQVIWLGVPYMKSKKLNGQMQYLNGVFESAVTDRAIWLPTEALLSDNSSEYRDTITVNGKKERVRSKDGIHFTPRGQRLIADYIQQHIDYQ